MKNEHTVMIRRLGSSIVCITFLLLLTITGCDKADNQPTAKKTSNVTTNTNTPPKQILPPPLSTDAIVSGALRIEPGGFDFGIIEPNSTHEVNAVIHNTGTVPISIDKVTPSCACTATQDLTKTVIPAGESIPFIASFKAPTEPGLKSAHITVAFKQGGTKKGLRIYLQGLVTMPLRAELPYVNAYERLKPGETVVKSQTGETTVTSMDGKPFRIITSGGKQPVYTDGFNPKADEPRNSYTVKWSIPESNINNCQGMRRWWVIETDHPDCPILPMRVRNECTGSRLDMTRRDRGWYFKEYIAQLNAIEAGKPVEAEVLLPVTKSGIKIQSVQSQSQNAHAQLISSITSDDGKSITCRVRFTPRKDYKGVIYAMVMFKSNTGSKDIPFIAKVVPPEKK